MVREEIEQAFANVGWELDGGFSGHLVIGRPRPIDTGLPVGMGERRSRVRDLRRGEEVTCWMREIPTPRQAATLLDEYGEAPEEERGNPHENDLMTKG